MIKKKKIVPTHDVTSLKLKWGNNLGEREREKT